MTFVSQFHEAGALDGGRFASSQDHPRGAGNYEIRPRTSAAVVSKLGIARQLAAKPNGTAQSSGQISRRVHREKSRRAGRKFNWASTAAQRAEIIVQIVRDKKAKSVIKSKAMTAGIISTTRSNTPAVNVVENDLGEFHRQLRHEGRITSCSHRCT